MNTCGICSKTMRKENLKRHMLTHGSKEVNEEDVIHDLTHKKELEMKLFDEDKEKFKRKLEHSQEEKINIKKNLHFDCSHCQNAHESYLNYLQNLPEWLKKSYIFV